MLEIPDSALSSPTPCADYTVGDLAEHVGGLAIAFTHAARKTEPPAMVQRDGTATELEPGWRDRVASDLDDLAAAWTDASAWEGETMAGPVELPAQVAALVALNELVVHGWDLAVAVGMPYDAAAADVERCSGFVATFEAPANDDGGLFGPPVEPGDGASALDRLVAMTGRDPGWSAGQ